MVVSETIWLDKNPFPKIYSDSVGTSEPWDYYPLYLQNESHFSLVLDGLDDNANVFLADEQNNIIAWSREPGNASELIEQDLEPGNYGVLVTSPQDALETPYNLTLSAEYIFNDIPAASPLMTIVDPEFEPNTQQVVWQSGPTLWVAPLDPQTGAVILTEATFVDNNLYPIVNVLPGVGVDWTTSSFNGPEWDYTEDNLGIIYTKNIEGMPVLYEARWSGSDWTIQVISDELGNLVEGLGILTEQEPNFSLISYSSADNETAYWQDLDNPDLGGIVPGSPRRWVSGERAILTIVEIDDVRQLVKYEVDTEIQEQLTVDDVDKAGNAFMWNAPEFENDQVFFVQETTIDVTDRFLVPPTQISIYVNQDDEWEKIKTISSPVPELPVISSPEPFVINGKSYISMLLSKLTPEDGWLFDGSEQIWIASIEPGEDFFRKVSNDEAIGSSPRPMLSPDPEPYVSSEGAFVYYTYIAERNNGSSYSAVNIADTGLGPLEIDPLNMEELDLAEEMYLPGNNYLDQVGVSVLDLDMNQMDYDPLNIFSSIPIGNESI